MGRGAGGRAGTRHVEKLNGLRINHGAPLFHVPTADTGSRQLVEALVLAGHVAEWRGTSGAVDLTTSYEADALNGLGTAGASRGEPAEGGEAFERYIGVPGMSSVAKGCLELARKDAGTDALDTHFSTRVKELIPQKDSAGAIVGWEILDKDGKSLGVFDWVVMSGVTPALSRWRAGFKQEPPIQDAAQRSGSQMLQDLVSTVDVPPLAYEGTQTATLVWDISKGGDAVEALSRLPFDVTHVTNDKNLAKVVAQSLTAPYAVLTLYSTPEFAERHRQVMGSNSYVSVSSNVTGSVDTEAEVGKELYSSFERLLRRFGGWSLPPPTWGPNLHRWGAAFPEPHFGLVGKESAWVLSAERMAFAGDYLAPPNACVATALRSALAAADGVLQAAQGLPVAPPTFSSATTSKL